MDAAEFNLYRIQLMTIKNQAKDLDEYNVEDVKKRLKTIKANIMVYERLLKEDV